MNQTVMLQPRQDQANLRQIAGTSAAPQPFASALFGNEQQVREIRNALETLLRSGEADDVIERLEDAVAALAEVGHPVAALCRAATLDSIEVLGWSKLTLRMAELDASGPRVTALAINISSQSIGYIDDSGEANPYLETAYFSDNAFGFSVASRAALLTGYSDYGAEWQDSFLDIDETLSISGLARLQAAVQRLEADFRSGPCANGADHDALFIGSAYLATRVHQAFREAVLTKGLPRPLTVLVGSNESSPFFDAPVITASEYRQFAAQISAKPAPVQPAALPAGAEPVDLAPYLAPAPAPAPASDQAEPVAKDEPSAGNALRRSMLARAAQAEADQPPPAPSKGPSLLGRLFRRR